MAASADRVREPLLRFVDHDLGPRDMLVVMKPLDSLFGIRLTLDRESAKTAIALFTGRKGDYAPSDDYEKEGIANAPGAIEAAREQITLSALNALAIHLGWLSDDARKTLLVVSEGFSGWSARRRRDLSLPTATSIVQ